MRQANLWEIEASQRGRTTVSAISLNTISRNRGNDSCSVNLPNDLIKDVGEKQIACRIQCQRPRLIQFRNSSLSSVAAVACYPGSGNSCDDAGSVDLPDPVVALVA